MGSGLKSILVSVDRVRVMSDSCFQVGEVMALFGGVLPKAGKQRGKMVKRTENCHGADVGGRAEAPHKSADAAKRWASEAPNRESGERKVEVA